MKKRSNGRETMEKILEHARAELDAHGAVEFNILRVIENSGVSRSSVYHHFGDRSGVIAAVEVDRFVAELKFLNDGVRAAVASATSVDQVMDLIEFVLRAAGSEEGRRQREQRLAVMVAARKIPVLAETLRDHQRSGDVHMADTIRLAAECGLISAVEDPEGVAHLFSSLFIGRAMVDVLDDPEADASWVRQTMRVIRRAMGVGPDGQGD